MSDVAPVLFLVGIAVLFWLVLIRPQARRQRELAHMQSTLEVGDEVMLTSGIHGTLRGLDEDVAQVEIADGVTIRVARGAVGQVLHEADAAPEAQPTTQPEAQPDAPADDEEVSEEN